MDERNTNYAPELPPYATANHVMQDRAAGVYPGYATVQEAARALGEADPYAPFFQVVDNLAGEIRTGRISKEHLAAGGIIAGALYDLEAQEAAAGPQPPDRNPQTQQFRLNAGLIRGYFAKELIGGTEPGGVLDRFKETAARTPSFGVILKARPGTPAMQVGSCPPLDLYQESSSGHGAPRPRVKYIWQGSPSNSAANKSVGGGGAQHLWDAVNQAVGSGRFAKDNLHFFSILPAENSENVLAFFDCLVTSNGDSRTSEHGDGAVRVFEMTREEAGFVHGRILRNPKAFMTFLGVANPGLDFDSYRMLNPDRVFNGRIISERDRHEYGPWLSTYPLHNATILSYDVLAGTMEKLDNENHPYSIGGHDYKDLWEKAATHVEVPPKGQ